MSSHFHKQLFMPGGLPNAKCQAPASRATLLLKNHEVHVCWPPRVAITLTWLLALLVQQAAERVLIPSNAHRSVQLPWL